METILSSDYTSSVLGVDENQLCLIDVNCEGIVRQITAEFPPDNRIVFAGQQQCAIIADWNKGVVCQSLVDGRVLWRYKKAIHATKLRMAADESSLIVCRNDPPMTLQLEGEKGAERKRKDESDGRFLVSKTGSQTLIPLLNGTTTVQRSLASPIAFGTQRRLMISLAFY